MLTIVWICKRNILKCCLQSWFIYNSSRTIQKYFCRNKRIYSKKIIRKKWIVTFCPVTFCDFLSCNFLSYIRETLGKTNVVCVPCFWTAWCCLDFLTVFSFGIFDLSQSTCVIVYIQTVLDVNMPKNSNTHVIFFICYCVSFHITLIMCCFY